MKETIQQIENELHKAFPYTKGKTIITESHNGVHLYTDLGFGAYRKEITEIMTFFDKYECLNSFTACMPCKYSFGDNFITVGIKA